MSKGSESGSATDASTAGAAKQLTPEATRALAEAAERRRAEENRKAAREIDGRGGPDPVRFGDWEVKGRATDF